MNVPRIAIAPGEGARISSRTIWIAAAILFAAAVLAVVAPRITYALGHETTDDAYVDAQSIVVTARTAGTIVAMNVVEGQHVRKGQVLASLDPTIARNAVAQARAALSEAQAQFAQAQSDVAVAQASFRSTALQTRARAQNAGAQSRAYAWQATGNAESSAAAQAAMAQAVAQLRAAKAQVPSARDAYTVAQRNYERLSTLAGGGYVSASSLDSALSAASGARAGYTAAVDQVRVAQSAVSAALHAKRAQEDAARQASANAAAQSANVSLAGAVEAGNSPALVDSKKRLAAAMEANVKAAQAELATAKYALSQTAIVSPLDGYVGQRVASIGQSVAIDDPAIVLMPSSNLYVTANFKETQIGRMKPGDAADIHVDAFPWIRFHGHVDQIGAASQSALSIVPNTQVPGNFVKLVQRVPIRVLIDGSSEIPPEPLRPGMSVEVSVRNPSR